MAADESKLYERLKEKLGEDRPFLLASALTFNVIVTTIPLLLIVVSGLGGLIASSGAVRQSVLEYLHDATPLSQTDARDLLDEVVADRGWLGTVGLVALAWTATRLFGSLRAVLEIIFEIPPAERFGFLEGKLHDIKMVFVVGTLFMLTVLLTSAFHATREVGSRVLGLTAIGLGWVGAGATVLVGAALTFAMFYFLYRHGSGRRIARFDAVIAGLFSTVMFEVAKQALVLYLSRYGRSVEVYGSFAGLIVAMLWVYYSCLVSLVGAEIASARRWARLQEAYRERPSE